MFLGKEIKINLRRLNKHIYSDSSITFYIYLITFHLHIYHIIFRHHSTSSYRLEQVLPWARTAFVWVCWFGSIGSPESTAHIFQYFGPELNISADSDSTHFSSWKTVQFTTLRVEHSWIRAVFVPDAATETSSSESFSLACLNGQPLEEVGLSMLVAKSRKAVPDQAF